MNPLRKIIQKTGLDLHRYRPEVEKLAWIKNQHIQTVLDIGANTGQFATHIRKILPEAQIYSFEPLMECFVALEKKFAEDTHFKAFHFALGESVGNMTMHKSAYTPSSSILPMANAHKDLFPHTREHTDETIDVKRLDDIDVSLQDNILIKVDVQGFEDKVIAGGEKVFARAKIVIMEMSFVELYSGQPDFNTLYQKLHTLGFTYHGCLEQKVDQKTGNIISEDSLFVK